MAVSADAVAGNEGAAARTMARRASDGSSEGGSDGCGAWKRVGCDLSRENQLISRKREERRETKDEDDAYIV